MDSSYSGSGGGLLLFIGILIYSLLRSAKPWKTLAYVLGWTIGMLVLFVVLAYWAKIPGEAAGEMGLLIGLLSGMLAALVHSRRNRISRGHSSDEKVRP